MYVLSRVKDYKIQFRTFLLQRTITQENNQNSVYVFVTKCWPWTQHKYRKFIYLQDVQRTLITRPFSNRYTCKQFCNGYDDYQTTFSGRSRTFRYPDHLKCPDKIRSTRHFLRPVHPNTSATWFTNNCISSRPTHITSHEIVPLLR